jgi:hypothetical protein
MLTGRLFPSRFKGEKCKITRSHRRDYEKFSNLDVSCNSVSNEYIAPILNIRNVLKIDATVSGVYSLSTRHNAWVNVPEGRNVNTNVWLGMKSSSHLDMKTYGTAAFD